MGDSFSYLIASCFYLASVLYLNPIYWKYNIWNVNLFCLTVFVCDNYTIKLKLWRFDQFFPNSLIIYQQKTKKITTAWLGYVFLITIKFANLCLEFLQELLTIWGVISSTQRCFSSDIETPRSLLIKTRLRLLFSTYFSVFGYLMKHTF